MSNGVVEFTGREFKEIFNLVYDKDGKSKRFNRKLFIFNSSLVTVGAQFSSKISVYDAAPDGKEYINSLEGFPNCYIELTDVDKLKVSDRVELYIENGTVKYRINSRPSDNIAMPLSEDDPHLSGVIKMLDVIDGSDSEYIDGPVDVFPATIERVSKIMSAFGINSAMTVSFSPMASNTSSNIMRGSLDQKWFKKSATVRHARIQIRFAATTVA